MVSIIITTYGGSKKLRRAIDSALNQTYKDFEVIVVDDNDPQSEARNSTISMMTHYKKCDNVIYVQHEKNMNGAAARNTGIKFSKGSYIAFLDDDDIYMPERLEKMVDIMESDRTLDGICCGVVLVYKDLIIGLVSQDHEKILTPNMLFEDQNIIGTGSNIFLKRDILCELKGFNTNFLRFQDVEFMIRASKIGKIKFCTQILVIKDSSDKRAPSYITVNDALLQFNDTFADDIGKLSIKSKNRYYRDRYLFLLMLAKLDGSQQEIIDVCDIMLKLGVCQNIALKISQNAKIIALYWKYREILKKNIAKGLYQKKKNMEYKKTDEKYRILMGNDKYIEIKHYLKG